MRPLDPTRPVGMRFARAAFVALVAALPATGCGSSATGFTPLGDGGTAKDGGFPVFTTSTEGGLPSFNAGDGATGTTGSGTGFSTGTGTATGGTGTTGPTGTSGSGTSVTTTSSSTPIPTSGVAITVIPNGTSSGPCSSCDAAPLLSAIQNAKVAVHVEMYLLTNDTYINALQALSKRLDVKVLLNQTFPSGSSASETNASSFGELSGGGVDVKWAPADPNGSSSGYTHEKAVIIDPGASTEQVWVMTMNLDNDAPKYNREYLAQDTNSADVAEAEQIFQDDFNGTNTPFSGGLVVAPVNAEQALLSLIRGASSSIDIEAEEIDETGVESDIFNELTSKARSGVTVRLVLEDSSDSSQTSAVTALEQAGGRVVGYSCSGNGLDIHAKAVVVDGTSAYVGSENFTGGSLGYNRELGVIFADPTEVQKVAATIASDFSGGATYSTTCDF